LNGARQIGEPSSQRNTFLVENVLSI